MFVAVLVSLIVTVAAAVAVASVRARRRFDTMLRDAGGSGRHCEIASPGIRRFFGATQALRHAVEGSMLWGVEASFEAFDPDRARLMEFERLAYEWFLEYTSSLDEYDRQWLAGRGLERDQVLAIRERAKSSAPPSDLPRLLAELEAIERRMAGPDGPGIYR